MTPAIRAETAADVAAIRALTACAFRDAGHTSHTEHLIVDALRGRGRLAVSLVAELQGILVGHVAISPVSIADGAVGWYGLGPVSVLPQHQRRGTGSRLVHEALRQLRGAGPAGCTVLGDPAFYGRFGFRAIPGLVLPGVPPQYFQALPFGVSHPQGVVTYDEAFEVRP